MKIMFILSSKCYSQGTGCKMYEHELKHYFDGQFVCTALFDTISKPKIHWNVSPNDVLKMKYGILLPTHPVLLGTDWLISVGLHFALSPSLGSAACSSCCQALSKAQQPVIGLTERLLPAQHRLLIKVQCVRCDFCSTGQFELIWDSWLCQCMC